MAAKRPAPTVHASRQGQVPQDAKRQRRKPDNLGKKSFKKAHPINDIKSQIRSLKRLLEHSDDLPATVRVEKERALQSAQHDLVRAQQAQEKSAMISRYHKIRFFDRQKATKRLKRARKALKSRVDEGGECEDLVRAVEDAEVDVNYAMYCPLHLPYVSLFPTRKRRGQAEDDGENDEVSNEDDTAEQERQGDPQMWEVVKQCMADGTLDALRNGRLAQGDATAESDERPEGMKKVASKGANKKTAAELKSGEDSDDAFFE